MSARPEPSPQGDDAPEVHRLRGTVRGRVQRVGYRMFVMQSARRHGCRGWVRNMPDGTVGFEAEGTEEALTELLTDLYRGPVMSHVEDIELSWSRGTASFTDFQIIR
jgi:acylphosphatase